MESSLLVAVSACLLGVLLLKWFLGDGKKKPPGPWNLPLVGYIPFLSRKPYLDLQKLARKYGNIFSVRLGSLEVLIINDYESTKDAFVRDEFIGRPSASPFDIKKRTIETEAVSGLPWKEQRRFMLHTLRDLGFGKSKMEAHIQEEINELLEHYEETAGEPILLRKLLTPSMSNNIASLAYGRRLKYDDPVRIMMTDKLNRISIAFGEVMWQLFFPWLRSILSFLGIGDVDRLKRIGREMREYTVKEIAEHEATLDPNNVRDFIDGYLLEMPKRKDDPSFCKDVLEDLVLSLFLAGSETVRLTIEWLVLVVAEHQEAQRRIQVEIDDVVGRNRLPTFATDQKMMPYTEAFITEVMRWRTIIPLNLMRWISLYTHGITLLHIFSTIVDTELGGYFIPKGTQLISNNWAIHHDREYWGEDADEFRPERFLSEDGKAFKHLNHMMPFSIGKRQCPGERLAQVEIFLYFTSILQRFHIQLPDGKTADLEEELGIGLMPKAQELILTKLN